MTAIVAVLNKHAVSVAADSAVTMGNTHKVVNSANKIFTLSKYHPIAVMTYSNAAFMSVPWDIILKEYRKQLGERSFPMLKDYVDDFIKYLHDKHFFCDEKTQQEYLKMSLGVFYELCCNEISRQYGISEKEIDSERMKAKLTDCMKNNSSATKNVEYQSYNFEEFWNYASAVIKVFSDSKKLSDGQLLDANLFGESFFQYFTSEFAEPINVTGLVFVGYGEKEIYPSLKSVLVSSALNGRLKYRIGECTSITEHGTAAVIIPFAQVDVTQTIIRGINPSFQDIISGVMDKSIRLFTNLITKILDGQSENETIFNVSKAIKGLDLDTYIKTATMQINNQMQESYTRPLLNTVVNLDKDDMANMAESFISLTSLVRRMQPGEETVGGPVDVAVISKGDGFIWIKRKHYFKPELNTHFFNNYFK